MADRELLHTAAERRLGRAGQRHTRQRRGILEMIATAGRPLTVPDLLASDGAGASQSSLYRNLVVLERVGVVQRVPGSGGHDLFELSEALSGHHHHHLTCTACGRVTDIAADDDVEKAIEAEARRLAGDIEVEITGHSVDLFGLCTECAD